MNIERRCKRFIVRSDRSNSWDGCLFKHVKRQHTAMCYPKKNKYYVNHNILSGG